MRLAHVSERSIAAVSRMREHGSVSRSTCARSRHCAAAGAGCQAPPNHANTAKDCSDLNLQAVLDELGLATDDVLVIGCAGEAIGFHDETTASMIKPRRGGYPEMIQDFSAFFTSEPVALATHMADCGFLAVELPDAHGYIHLTRMNMAAMDALKIAADHYGANVSDARLRLVAAISGPNFPQYGDPEERFPGWAEAGFIRRRDDRIWEPDNRGMMRKQILDAGVAPEQLDMADVLDPGDLSLGHASHSAGMRGEIRLGRDAYLIGPRTLIKGPATQPGFVARSRSAETPI